MKKRDQSALLVSSFLHLLLLLPEIQAFSTTKSLLGSRIRRPALAELRHPIILFSNDDDDQDISLDRLGGVRQAVSDIANTGLKDSVQVGDVIIAKMDLPRQQIYANQGYQIIEIYDQVVDDQGQVGKIPVVGLEDVSTAKSGQYTRYLQLQVNTDGASVIVTPEEIGLVTLKDELTLSVLLAIPGFFWVVVAWNFANYYTERYGGNFLDAMFRT